MSPMSVSMLDLEMKIKLPLIACPDMHHQGRHDSIDVITESRCRVDLRGSGRSV